jgi:hypothetical protein
MTDLPELPEPRCVLPYTLLDMQAYAIAYAKQVREQVETDRDRLSAEVEKLRGFAQAVMSEWPDVGCDGFDLQTYGEKFGLLEMQKRIAPCGEHCNCVEYETGEVECYRLTKLIKGDSAMGGSDVDGVRE